MGLSSPRCLGLGAQVAKVTEEAGHSACMALTSLRGAQERKDLLKDNPREKHNNWGSLLLGLGVAIAVEGPVNTYLRTGEPAFACGAVEGWASKGLCLLSACMALIDKGGHSQDVARLA